MTEMLNRGREILALQPFSRLLGAELIDFSQTRAELRIVVTEQLKQQHGFVHGGVISYAADNALTFAGGGALGGGGVVTSEYKINYLRPAIGDVLIAKAHVVHVGKTQAVCRCDIFIQTGANEKLCAVAQGTVAKLADASPK